MSKPSNPYEIIIQNKFFPKGLNEETIYSYWMKNKIDILTYLRDKRVVLYLQTEHDKTIIRRLIKHQIPFQLNDKNYEHFINGRIVGILEVFDEKSNFGIIDIDSPKNEKDKKDKDKEEISNESTFNQVKDLAADVYDFFSKMFNCSILYTGKNGFHIRCSFHKHIQMDKIKEILKKNIESSKLKIFFSKRNETQPNIDLSPNMRNGVTIIPRSLNKIGLPCTEVKRDELLNFKRESLIKELNLSYDDI